MAKSTNHTAHNQSYKNHRNGIKKPMQLGKGQRRSMKGVRAALTHPFPLRPSHLCTSRAECPIHACGAHPPTTPRTCGVVLGCVGAGAYIYVPHICSDGRPRASPEGGEAADPSAPAACALCLPQMDPKFLRNLRFAKKWNGKGRGSDE